MPCIVYTVQWARGDAAWCIRRGPALVEEYLERQHALGRAAELARGWGLLGQRARVVVKSPAGRVAFERTYGCAPRRHED